MEKRFRALRTIGTLLKILAWIVLVLAILGSILVVIAGAGASLGAVGDTLGQDVAGYAAGGILGSLVVGGGFLLGGVIYFIMLYAAAEGIYVLISIEENTRATALAVSGRASM